MRYIWSLSIAVGVIATGAMNASPARGDLFTRMKHSAAHAWESVCRGYEQNRDWPEPYYHEDKLHVRQPFKIMIAKGWRQQNTLGSHHFRENKSELTEAGRLRIAWIANHAFDPHRTVFVQQAGDAEATEERIAAVHDFLAGLETDITLPQVVESSDGIRGWPADEIDSLERRFEQSAPPPRLPGRKGLDG